jgi:hypothetical protein
VLSLGLPHSVRQKGADDSVEFAPVFSGAFGFRIGGVSLMPLRLVLADATMVGGWSSEIAMMMRAPSATHRFRKRAPRDRYLMPGAMAHCAATEIHYPRSAPDEQSTMGRAGRADTCRKASRTIADRRGIATTRGTPSGFYLGGENEALIHSYQLRTSHLSRPPTEKENPSNFYFFLGNRYRTSINLR